MEGKRNTTASSSPSTPEDPDKRIAELEEQLARKEAELDALINKESIYRAVVESAPDYIFVVDAECRVVFANPFAASSFRCEPEDLYGQPIDVLFPEPVASRQKENVRKVLTSGRPLYLEAPTVYPDGTHWLATWLVPFRALRPGVALDAVLGISRDLTQRRQAESQLKESEERLAVTLASIGEAVITTDTGGLVVTMNAAAERLTGWNAKDATALPFERVLPLVDERTGEPARAASAADHLAFVDAEGRAIPVSLTSAPIRTAEGRTIGSVVVVRDVSEQRAREEELRRIEKLESIGVLAGGIAHDFNNILTAVLGNISIARRRLSDDPRADLRLEEAEKAVHRARDLANQLLTFSQDGAPIKALTSVRRLIEESAVFVLSGSPTACAIDMPDGLWSVEVDAGQITQVISNLVINADQAMDGGGKIEIRGENVEIAAPGALPLAPGRYVRLTVRDEGAGIPAEHLDQVFDPYFTTKKNGTGLGLTTTYSILRRHGGHITVESAPGVGTTFHVFLPASTERASTRPAVREDPFQGRGRILVMDDEPMILEIAREILMDAGFEVEIARDGASAAGLYEAGLREGRRFDAVVMDLTIPGGVGGLETLRRLKEMDGRVRVLVSSGYSNDPIMSDFSVFGFAGVVSKPYGAGDLVSAVRRVLE